jgi:hypothetical protein
MGGVVVCGAGAAGLGGQMRLMRFDARSIARALTS